MLQMVTSVVVALFFMIMSSNVFCTSRETDTVKAGENADVQNTKSWRHGGLTWNTLLTLVRTKFTCYISHLFLPLLWLKNRNSSKDVFTSHLDLHYRLYMLPHGIHCTKVLKLLRGRETVPPKRVGFTAEWRSCGDCESCGHFLLVAKNFTDGCVHCFLCHMKWLKINYLKNRAKWKK